MRIAKVKINRQKVLRPHLRPRKDRATPGDNPPNDDARANWPTGALAWMRDPCDLPPAAGLRSSASLGELLSMLGAPPPAAMS